MQSNLIIIQLKVVIKLIKVIIKICIFDTYDAKIDLLSKFFEKYIFNYKNRIRLKTEV